MMKRKKIKQKKKKQLNKIIRNFSFNNFETINNEVVLSNFSFFLISYLSLVTFFRFSFLSFSYRNKKIITTFCDGKQKQLKKIMMLPQTCGASFKKLIRSAKHGRIFTSTIKSIS